MKAPYWFVISGTRGAETRGRILRAVRAHPRTVPQLADWLDLERAEVRDHLEALRENDLVETTYPGGGQVYLTTVAANEDWRAIERLLQRVDGDVSGSPRRAPTDPK